MLETFSFLNQKHLDSFELSKVVFKENFCDFIQKKVGEATKSTGCKEKS